jgi:thiamine pyrophosphokinase
MVAPVLCADRGVTLIGGAGATPAAIASALCHAPVVAAADGGAAFALAAGHTPAAVIGDMDSLDPASRARIEPDRLHPVAEQDSTDFEKCLDRIVAPLILALGFTGGRLDHQLAAFAALLRPGAGRVVLLGPEDAAIHMPAQIVLDLAVGTRLSLFPMAPTTGRSQGLEWPIDGLRFAPDGQIGTSNRVAATPVRLSVDAPGMLLIVPLAALDALLDGLRSAQ